MPRIINNNRNHSESVYVVERSTMAALPASFQEVVAEVENHPGTPGNYLLLPGANVEISVGKFVIAATTTTLCFNHQQVNGNDINIWN